MLDCEQARIRALIESAMPPTARKTGQNNFERRL
jgi:hypothetical protein